MTPISPQTRKKPRDWQATESDPAPRVQMCDAPECLAEGTHRAPKSRDELHDYHWFCLDHVRDYNKAWNYCAGMGAGELEAMIRGQIVGERPTWPMGYWRVKERATRETLYEEFLREGKAREQQKKSEDKWAQLNPRGQALKTLGLTDPVTFETVRARYRVLVKQHHPDRAGGTHQADDMIKRINQAYSVLKALERAEEG